MLKRRDFLQVSLLGMAAAFLPACASLPLGSRKKKYYLTSPFFQAKNEVLVLDLENFTQRSIPLPGKMAHGYAQNPLHPAQVVCAVPKEATSWVIDVSSGKRIAQIEAGRGNHFVAHAVFSPLEPVFYAGESDGNRGTIGIFDARTYQRLGEFPSLGDGPHDMVILEKSRQLVVSDYSLEKKRAGIFWLELPSGKRLQEKVSSDYNFHWGHLSKRGETVYVNSQRFEYLDEKKFNERMAQGDPMGAEKWRRVFPSPSYFARGLHTLEVPLSGGDWELMGFSASASGDGALAGCTYGPSSSVGIFSFAEERLVKQVKFSARTQGICPSFGGGFLVSTVDGKLWQVDGPDFVPRQVAVIKAGDHSFSLWA